MLTAAQVARRTWLSIPLARRDVALRDGSLDAAEFRAELITHIGELDPVLGGFVNHRLDALRVHEWTAKTPVLVRMGGRPC